MSFPPSPHRNCKRGRNINRLPISCGSRHCLRTASPVVDCHCHGNLGFSGYAFLTRNVVTHANILSSKRSSRPRGSTFSALRMLSYRSSYPKVKRTRVFGILLKPRYIFGAVNHRIVSCYTLFKGWLPLSQPPICQRFTTTFHTEQKFRDLRLRSGLFPLRTWSLAPTF